MIAAEFAIAEGRNTDAEDLLHYIAPHPTSPSPDTSYQQWLFAVERLVGLRIADHDLDGARAWLEAFDNTLEQNPHVPGELLFDLARARYQIASGEAREAEQTLVAATARAERTHNMLALVQAQRLLAEAHLALNQVEQALQAARRAEQEAANCALVYERTCALVLIAEVLIRAGDRSGEAMDVLAEASETLTGLGATALLAKAEQLMRRPLRTAGGEHLTRRELDVLRLVVAGNTDAEIGNQLYISPRTVGTHISNMLGKTGTSNRVELATWAMSRRLVER
jgi:DNA-binding CsgD family transcriptional regulator